MLGLTRHTVRKFARAATAGQVTTGPSPRSSRLDRFAPYLQQRWEQGCTHAAQPFAEIQAQATPAASGQRAATCSRRDKAAVIYGLTLKHSSGAVEGNVCRIKALKRQMYGRASPTSSGRESCSVTNTTQSHQFTDFAPEPLSHGHGYGGRPAGPTMWRDEYGSASKRC
jgi:hypothetical protein